MRERYIESKARASICDNTVKIVTHKACMYSRGAPARVRKITNRHHTLPRIKENADLVTPRRQEMNPMCTALKNVSYAAPKLVTWCPYDKTVEGVDLTEIEVATRVSGWNSGIDSFDNHGSKSSM
jgi:hypothetical protein